ncbi:MAG: hypothetical protein WC087_04200 [Candidatus Paceibacterota bacterium]
MGKIRVKSFDETENAELEAKKKAKREAKKSVRQAQDESEKEASKKAPVEIKDETETVTTPEEEIKTSEETVSTPDKTIAALEQSETNNSEDSDAQPTESKRTKKEKFIKKKILSDRVNANRKMVSKSQTYPLDKAVNLLTQFKTSKFDESVELHVNVREQGTSGSLALPHGSGKTLRIKVADDAILAEIESGKIDFDVLIATPDMMPRLAKVARVLGPRGLMPNPKNGTVTTNPDEAVKKLSGGEMRFKTEPKAPVIHLMIGKVSFGEAKILDNVKTTIDAIDTSKIKSAVLSSTMSPGIRLALSSN